VWHNHVITLVIGFVFALKQMQKSTASHFSFMRFALLILQMPKIRSRRQPPAGLSVACKCHQIGSLHLHLPEPNAKNAINYNLHIFRLLLCKQQKTKNDANN